MEANFRKAVIVGLIMVFCGAIWSVSAENHITVYGNVNNIQISPLIYGNNLIAYDPSSYENNRVQDSGVYSNYGSGIWNPSCNSAVKECVELANNAGITVLRFPGGCGTHHYDWKAARGKNRTQFKFGLSEYLSICEQINAKAIITVSYYSSNENDAADLVEYLNLRTCEDRPNDGWSNIRLVDGHKEPYNVKYFEIGNEEWHGDHKKIKHVSPKEYANRYLKYYDSMKSKDSSIKIGVILGKPEWNKEVMDIVRDKVDYGILHMYPSPKVSDQDLKSMGSNNIYYETLGMVITRYEVGIKNASLLLNEKAGKIVPLAVTEYNAGIKINEPTKYRYCLGTALLNAELLKIFMKPENSVFMAAYWQYCNSYWGMVSNGFNGKSADLDNKYYKRPNYYVYEMYNKHFGNIYLNTYVEADSYKYDNINIPYLSVNASTDSNGKKLYIMVINKNLENAINADILIKEFIPGGVANAWVLNGPNVDATNEEYNNVKVIHRRYKIDRNTFCFTFEPHSLTAIEIERARN